MSMAHWPKGSYFLPTAPASLIICPQSQDVPAQPGGILKDHKQEGAEKTVILSPPLSLLSIPGVFCAQILWGLPYAWLILQCMFSSKPISFFEHMP